MILHKGSDVIISIHDTTKLLKLYSRCGHMTKFWLIKHFYERNYHNSNFIRIWLWSWFKLNSFRLVLVMILKFYSCVGKRLKLKVRKYCEKLAGNLFALPPPPILNKVESKLTNFRPVKTVKKGEYRFHCFIDCSVEVTSIFTVIILENVFVNIQSAVFTYRRIGEGGI